MKYPVNTIVLINDREWRVAEYRMGRGREWVYTLSIELTDGSFDTMRLNESAIAKILVEEPQGELAFDTSMDEVFA
tara:strand:+ start:1027 stop:1254 length:228 start_codon:yes stop_codon:yes gene_type:complete